MTRTLPGTTQDVGIDIVDDQHAVMRSMIQEIRSAHSTGDHPGSVVDRIAHLYQYAQIHFDTEEALIERYASERLDPHRAEHGRLLVQLRRAVVNYKRHGEPVANSLVDHLDAFMDRHACELDPADLEPAREALARERELLTTTDS